MKAWMMAAGVLLALPAAAQFKNIADAVEYRQGAFTVMGTHFGRIGAMVNGKTPFDAKALQAEADVVVFMARLPWPAFVEGSDKGDTGAKPEIWSQAARFKASAQKLQDSAGALAEAARKGDQDAIKTAFGTTAQACKGCHDDFRRKH